MATSRQIQANTSHLPGAAIVAQSHTISNLPGQGNNPGVQNNPELNQVQENVQTPQGNVVVSYRQQVVGNTVAYVASGISKNQVFTQPAAQNTNTVSGNATATYTYTLSNGTLKPTLTGTSGTVQQKVYGSIGTQQNTYLGTFTYTPTTTNGAINFGTPTFQSTNVSYTTPTYVPSGYGAYIKVGLTVQGTTSYNPVTGQVSANFPSNPQLSGNLYLSPQSTTVNIGGTPEPVKFNVSLSNGQATQYYTGFGANNAPTATYSTGGTSTTYNIVAGSIAPTSTTSPVVFQGASTTTPLSATYNYGTGAYSLSANTGSVNIGGNIVSGSYAVNNQGSVTFTPSQSSVVNSGSPTPQYYVSSNQNPYSYAPFTSSTSKALSQNIDSIGSLPAQKPGTPTAVTSAVLSGNLGIVTTPIETGYSVISGTTNIKITTTYSDFNTSFPGPQTLTISTSIGSQSGLGFYGGGLGKFQAQTTALVETILSNKPIGITGEVVQFGVQQAAFLGSGGALIASPKSTLTQRAEGLGFAATLALPVIIVGPVSSALGSNLLGGFAAGAVAGPTTNIVAYGIGIGPRPTVGSLAASALESGAVVGVLTVGFAKLSYELKPTLKGTASRGGTLISSRAISSDQTGTVGYKVADSSGNYYLAGTREGQIGSIEFRGGTKLTYGNGYQKINVVGISRSITTTDLAGNEQTLLTGGNADVEITTSATTGLRQFLGIGPKVTVTRYTIPTPTGTVTEVPGEGTAIFTSYGKTVYTSTLSRDFQTLSIQEAPVYPAEFKNGFVAYPESTGEISLLRFTGTSSNGEEFSGLRFMVNSVEKNGVAFKSSPFQIFTRGENQALPSYDELANPQPPALTEKGYIGPTQNNRIYPVEPESSASTQPSGEAPVQSTINSGSSSVSGGSEIQITKTVSKTQVAPSIDYDTIVNVAKQSAQTSNLITSPNFITSLNNKLSTSSGITSTITNKTGLTSVLTSKTSNASALTNKVSFAQDLYLPTTTKFAVTSKTTQKLVPTQKIVTTNRPSPVSISPAIVPDIPIGTGNVFPGNKRPELPKRPAPKKRPPPKFNYQPDVPAIIYNIHSTNSKLYKQLGVARPILDLPKSKSKRRGGIL